MDVTQNSAPKICFLGFCGKQILKKGRRDGWQVNFTSMKNVGLSEDKCIW